MAQASAVGGCRGGRVARALRRGLLVLAILAAWLRASAAAPSAPGHVAEESPLLLVLCENFDLVCPFRVDGGGLTAAGPPTSVSAPHDAVWLDDRRVLLVTAVFKAQPCIIPYAVSADGALRRVGDPIPTRDRAADLVRLGPSGRVVLAVTRAHVQAFPVDAAGLPSPPCWTAAGADALVVARPDTVVTLRAGRVQAWTVDPENGALTPLGEAVDGGAQASALALDVDGRTLYVLNLADFTHHICVLDLDARGVRAAGVPPLHTLSEAQRRMYCTPRAAYVLNASDTLSRYGRVDGALREGERPVVTAVGACDLREVGDVVCVVGAGEPSVRVHRVDRDRGRLRAGRSVPLPAGAAGTRLLLLDARAASPAASPVRAASSTPAAAP